MISAASQQKSNLTQSSPYVGWRFFAYLSLKISTIPDLYYHFVPLSVAFVNMTDRSITKLGPRNAVVF